MEVFLASVARWKPSTLSIHYGYLRTWTVRFKQLAIKAAKRTTLTHRWFVAAIAFGVLHPKQKRLHSSPRSMIPTRTPTL